MKSKTLIQIERRIKWLCKEVNEMNKEFIDSDDTGTRNYLSGQISGVLIQLLELKWCSGINYDKYIK